MYFDPQENGPAGTEIDLLSPGLGGPQFWSAAHEVIRNGPLVWMSARGGYWVTTTYDVLRRISQDHDSFSSGQGVTIERPSVELQPYVMPIEIDPPKQTLYRRNVNPHLSPKALEGLQTGIRQIADELIDTFVESGTCNIATDFARILPGTVFFRLLVHVDDTVLEVMEPLARALSFDPDPLKRAEASRLMREWAATMLDAAHDNPMAHVLVEAVGRLADSGEDFADHELESGVQLLAQGGIGTSAQLIGSIMVMLAENQDLQERVRNDLSLVPSLVEEALRLEPPVMWQFRTATRDVEVDGAQISKGQKVGLFYGAANRDGAVFERPDEVDIDRRTNPHLAFGTGIHRCVGSNLARLQVRVATEQLLTRFGTFRLQDGATVQYLNSFQRGPISVPLDFIPGPRRSIADQTVRATTGDD